MTMWEGRTTNGNDSHELAPSSAVTSAGVTHVLLSYHYLDSGDIDGYGSLLDEHAQVNRPDLATAQGRTQVLGLHADIAGPPAQHHIYKVIADGDAVVATGRFTAPSTRGGRAAVDAEFVDVFTLSGKGMLLGYRRFYFAAPCLR
jgi:hypothetical protein